MLFQQQSLSTLETMDFLFFVFFYVRFFCLSILLVEEEFSEIS